MADNNAAGQSIRALRTLASMTLEDVASLVPTTASYISKVETGKAHPTHYWVGNVVGAIADVLAEKRRTTAA